MKNAPQRLMTLKVGDVMARNVVNVSTSQSMSEVAVLLAEHNISGVPVVDEHGLCVGVISANDFVKRESVRGKLNHAELSMQEHALMHEDHDAPLQIVECPNDLVSDYMTPSVQSVTPESMLSEAARIMSAQHIHRLPVLNHQGHPEGVLTSTDIVAAVVNVIDEASR